MIEKVTSILTNTVADEAIKRASIAPIVRKRGANYEAIYFARVMTDYMVEQFNQPLRDVVVAVGGLFFDNIDDAFVRKNAPTRKKTG